MDYPNGDVITCAYDGVGRLTEIKGAHGATVISDYDYTYDAAGNRLTTTTSAGTTSYQYDGDYRLKKATRPGGAYTEYWYDEAGNRAKLTDTTGGVAKTTTYGYDLNDRLTLVTHPDATTTSYEYDGNGNQLRLVQPEGTTVFTYDEENRLVGIGCPDGSTVEYQYDGQGRRVRMKDPNVEVFYQYSGGQVISDRDGAGAVICYYIRGLGGWLISNVQTAGTRYYHFDGLGSVVALTDAAGVKVSSYTYDEFGVLTQSTGQSWNSFKYTSSTYDSAPDLYLMGARYYDPALGRFITQDTWEGRTWEPWTKNLYAYGRGNPVTFIDPAGHAAVLPDGTIIGTEVDKELLALKQAYENATSDEERARIAHDAVLLRQANPGGYTVLDDKSLDDYRVEGILTALENGLLTPEGAFEPLLGLLGEPTAEVFSVGASGSIYAGIGFQIDRVTQRGGGTRYFHTSQAIVGSLGWSVNIDRGWAWNTESLSDFEGRSTGVNVTDFYYNGGAAYLGTNSKGEVMVLFYMGINYPKSEHTAGLVWSTSVVPLSIEAPVQFGPDQT